MRYLLSIIFAVASLCSGIGQVTGGEYFIDTDPGYGKATAISIVSGTNISKDFTVGLSSASPGFHIVSVRAYDAQGHWSHTLSHSFYIIATPASNIIESEYFIDTDPGYGKASHIQGNVGSDSALKYIVPLSDYTSGFHLIAIRSKDDQGRWSHTQSHSFYVTAEPASAVTESEYYIDTDPGYGKALRVPVAVDIDSTLKFVVPLTAETSGFHKIGFRSKDNKGVWSHTLEHAFYVDENREPVNITSLQYYFKGAGATDEIYTYDVPVPASIVDLNFTADLSKLAGDREYEMHIWAVNAKGVRSEVLVKKIKVCNDQPAKARFDFITMGTEVSFIDSSRGGSKYKWDFGDGKIDSVSNPVHNYATGSNYNVKMIVSNFCNSDTVSKVTNVLTLQGLYPNIGGNNGTITISIVGAGFTNMTEVKLVGNGTELIGKNNWTTNDGKLLYSTIELYEKEIGTYDLEVKSPTQTVILKDKFRVEIGDLPIVKANIEGRNVIRPNVLQNYSVLLNNVGNVDSKGVPVWIAVPKGSKLNFDFRILVPKDTSDINYDSVSLFTQTDTFFGKAVSMDIYSFILHNIPAGQTRRLNFGLILSNSGSIYVWTSLPFYGSPLRSDIGECLSGTISRIGDFVAPVGCAASIIDLLLSPLVINDSILNLELKYKNYRKPESMQVLMDRQKLYQEVSSTILNAAVFDVIRGCTGFKALKNKQYRYVNEWAEDFRKIVIGNLGNYKKSQRLKIGDLEKVYDILDDTFPEEDGMPSNDYKTIDACANVVEKTGLLEFLITAVTSFDPNEKVGTHGSSSQNYNGGLEPFNYKIYFENVDTATAPAQEVVVIDTLDILKFDLSTFQLQSYGFGDSINTSIPAGLSSYATTTLLRRTSKPDLSVRVDAKLDTATGILKWRFLSIDPATRELIDDPLDGFLPPNKRSPEGEGFVSYSIMPKADLPHRTEIKNKASIYFDNNAPIVTNEFLNTVDKVKPISKVSALPAEAYDSTFVVKWSGIDADAGVRSYDVYYSINGGPFQLWQYDVSTDSSVFTGQYDSTYRFFSIAKDYAGNIEASKSSAEATIRITRGVLPITSMPLRGVLNQNLTVSLNWSTLTETNNKGFDIERNSGNGWVKIGFVKGIGNSTNENRYSYIDSGIVTGKTYQYRYKQLDFDNRFSYSNEVSIVVKDKYNTLSITAAPNPFSGKTTITYSVPVSGNITLKMMDYTGKEVAKLVNGYKQAGVHRVELNTPSLSLAAGTYFLNIMDNKESITSKIVLIR